VNAIDIDAAKRDVAEAKKILQIAEARIARLESKESEALLAETRVFQEHEIAKLYSAGVIESAEELTEVQIDAAINTKLFWYAFEIKKMSGRSLADCVNEVVAGIREMQSVCGPHNLGQDK
jgi:hypothetical protein